MSEIIAFDADDAYVKVLKLLKDANEYSPRGQKVKEVLNLSVIIENALLSVIENPARKLNKSYVEKEIEWYREATSSIHSIKDYASMWSKIADDNDEVNSNYGVYIWNQKTPEGISQFDYVIDTLVNDKDSRQAVININQVSHKYETKDYPCTLSIQYFIRDDELVCITNMRSNDIVFGFGNDVPFFTYLQYLVCEKLKDNYPDLKLGDYCHNAGSMHIYSRHYDLMDESIKQNVKSSSVLDLNVPKKS